MIARETSILAGTSNGVPPRMWSRLHPWVRAIPKPMRSPPAKDLAAIFARGLLSLKFLPARAETKDPTIVPAPHIPDMRKILQVGPER